MSHVKASEPCEQKGMGIESSRLPFADGHCDLLYGIVNSGYNILAPRGKQAVSLNSLMEGNVRLQLFAAWIDVNSKRSYGNGGCV